MASVKAFWAVRLLSSLRVGYQMFPQQPPSVKQELKLQWSIQDYVESLSHRTSVYKLLTSVHCVFINILPVLLKFHSQNYEILFLYFVSTHCSMSSFRTAANPQ